MTNRKERTAAEYAWRKKFALFLNAAAANLRLHSAPMAADIAGAFLESAGAKNLRGAKDGGVLMHFPPANDSLLGMIRECFARDSESDYSFLDDAAFGKNDIASLFAAAGRLSPHLFWRAAGNGQAAVAAAELVGPSGIAECARFRAGVFFQPPQMFYEWHRHAAEELYLPIFGTAEWLAEGESPATLPPSSLIYHRSWQAHAMRTFDSPLCAIWGWRGDIAMEHYEFCPAPI